MNASPLRGTFHLPSTFPVLSAIHLKYSALFRVLTHSVSTGSGSKSIEFSSDFSTLGDLALDFDLDPALALEVPLLFSLDD